MAFSSDRWLDFRFGLSEPKPLDPFKGIEKVFQPLVVTQQAIDDLSSRSNDLAGNQDEHLQKTTKLHPQYLVAPCLTRHQQSEPSLQVPEAEKERANNRINFTLM